jgi:SAM-dependent methyltransferase
MILNWPNNKIDADPVVRSFVRRHVHSPETFVSRIDEDDEMFLFDLQAHKGDRRRTAIGYYTIGSRFCDAIRQIADWQFGGLQNVGSFLDFACGYGRFTRFLIREMPPKSIWACDIYSNAIKFQRRYFGVNGIVSVPDPANFPKGQKFDFIFASSFFSHMPETTFARWMETLLGLLTSRGILVFSVHDVSLLPPSVLVPPTGIVFVADSESRTLDKNQYGSTFVNEQFVAGVVHRVTGGKASLQCVRRGLVGYQDIYILTNSLNREASNFRFVHGPCGNVDSCHLSPAGEAFISGWAADINDGGTIKEIQILSNGEVIKTVSPDHDRADVAAFFQRPSLSHSGWSCHLSSDRIGADDIIEIRVINNQGRHLILSYNHLESMLSRSAVAG